MSTLSLPTEARVIAYDAKDGLGTLRTPEGVEVRFGASACTDFTPEQGMTVWLVETKPDPLGRGERAKVVNRSGHVEQDRLTQIWDEHAAADARVDLETALLDRLDLPEQPEPSEYEALSPEDRVRLAAEVMELRRTSHLFEEAFIALVELDASLLHPYLGELSYLHEPESLAWTDAPLEAVTPLMAELHPGWHSQREHLPVGTVMPHDEAQRREREPGDPVAAAALALARSGHDDVLRALEGWLLTLDAKQQAEAVGLLSYANVVRRPSGLLVRNFTPACLEVYPEWEPEEDDAPEDLVAHGALWNPIPEATCAHCGSELVDALRLDGDRAAHGLPWPARLPTCFTCISSGEEVYVKVSADGGTVRSLSVDLHPPITQRPGLPEAQPVGFRRGRAWRSLMMSDREERHRLGGAPSWVDGPDVKPCPRCAEPMHAVGQVADTDADFSDNGMLYGVACEPCGVLCTFAST
ncbi:hypothetical protein [Pyxidicoccus xibeiensis]|uniref:hypothetical protein n=1 Tax=Pyxidicoccus xibeiensis TaxID=2906759 RepID=UPI0020A8034B|nr:hypothetical protein [Pyxidicoccus xibeiensis]MCP3136510.1 hypothetical protein [Pyxidicoccus xibeiensis]